MPKCFVISPIGEAASETRKRSDGFLREVIKPVAESLGYIVERADEDKSPGIVTESIVNKIIDADLVIADLHGHNPNVMYEVAIRHATDKPLVQMAEFGESLPFDIGGLNTVFYDSSVSGLAQWRSDLERAISAIGTDTRSSNPVVRAGLMRTLQSQPGSEGAALSALLDEVQRLKYEVRASKSSDGYYRLDNTRVLLPPDQYVYASITNFLMSSPTVSGRRFMVVAKDKELVVSVLPKGLEGKADSFRYEFKYEPEANIGDEVARLKVELLRDIERLSQGEAQA